MLEHALEYLRRGWSVFPCRPRGKDPLIKWRKYTKRRPTEDEVREWWAKWPNANIAIICGTVSGIAVIDVDPQKGADAGSQPDTGLRAVSGGKYGGSHLFYKLPPGCGRVSNRVGKDGFDVRGDGGYVIAAPSIHPDTGDEYRWASEGTPAPAPAWVLEHAHSDGTPVNSEKWLSELISDGTSRGTRNDDVARYAGYLAKKEIPDDIAEMMIIQWMSDQEDPLHPDEIRTTVKSVYRTASRSRGRNGKIRRELNGGTSGFGYTPLDLYMHKHGTTEVEWLVDGWMPKDTIAFVASPPGGYKTWFTFDLAVSIATGKPFLDQFEVNNTGPVLLVQQEDFHGQIAQRLATIIAGKYSLRPPSIEGDQVEIEVPPRNIEVYLHEDRNLRFSDEEVFEEFRKVIAELRPKLVIIDPLYSAAETEGYMAKSVEDMMPLKKMRDMYGCSFLMVHHTKKSTEDWDRQGMWGSQFLNAFLETGWHVRTLEDEGSAVIIKRHFKVAPNPEFQKVNFGIDTSANHAYKVEVTDATEDESERAVTRTPSKGREGYLEALSEGGPCTASELAERTGKNKSSVSRALKALLADNEVEKNENGVWSRVELPGF